MTRETLFFALEHPSPGPWLITMSDGVTHHLKHRDDLKFHGMLEGYNGNAVTLSRGSEGGFWVIDLNHVISVYVPPPK